MSSPMTVDNSTGYLRNAQGQYFMPLGYNEAPSPNISDPFDIKRHRALGMDTQPVYFDLQAVLPTNFTPSPEAVASIVAAVNVGALANTTATLFIGNGRQASKNSPGSNVIPKWAIPLYPGIVANSGSTHFYNYDIDNPGVKLLFQAALNAVIPPIVETGVLLSVSLSNEPGFQSANSTYTLRNFQTHLQTIYPSIGALNAAWSSHFANFSDPRMVQAMGYVAFGNEHKVVWTRFNQQRVTAFYDFLATTIHRAAASVNGTVHVHLKASNGNTPLGQGHDIGIDRAALADIMDIHGCDTRALPIGKPHIPFQQNLSGAYAMDWYSITGSYDFMLSSSAKRKAVIDTEWHTISTVTFRQPVISYAYMQACMWLASTHGLSLAQIWYWGRDNWLSRPKLSNEFAGADFAFSLLTQPQMLDAFVRTRNQINALGDVAVSIATRTPTVYILYSETSAILATATRDTTIASYALCHHLGVKLAFISEHQIKANLAILASAPAIIVPSTVNVQNSTVVAFKQLSALSTGPLVLRTGTSSSLAAIFTRDELDRNRSQADIAFVQHWPQVTIDIIDEPTMLAMESALKNVLPTAGLRCVRPGTTSSAILGLYCAATQDQTRIVIVNMLINSTDVEVQLPSSSMVLRDAWDRSPVDGSKLTLASLENRVLEAYEP
eukprot:TRINITY_DN9269_c0_g2_i1.p1 TRINITY_DN9269_c0_g2~~TRINITY_DN9269_c0_g2_i1.p1  ORF type:complete len:686 (+),score=138.56 TRINITY_DN9269_c0_g2_i1:62-2059(+)